jgi:hypothetical protein
MVAQSAQAGSLHRNTGTGPLQVRGQHQRLPGSHACRVVSHCRNPHRAPNAATFRQRGHPQKSGIPDIPGGKVAFLGARDGGRLAARENWRRVWD